MSDYLINALESEIDDLHVNDVEEAGGKILVEYHACVPSGDLRAVARERGFEIAGVLSGDDALEAGAEENYHIAAFVEA